MRRKGYLGLLLLGLLVFCAGCGKKEESLTLLVRNNQVKEALETKFPDIPFQWEYYDGKNTTTALQMQMKNQDITDIYLGTLPMLEEDAKANLMDLSRYAFCSNYEPSMLEQCDIGGKIYQLPSATTIRCMIYNQEMFREHGWKEPKDFSELIALCRQIREETEDITPIVFGGAGVGYYFTTMTTYAQAEFLYTPEGKEWEKSYFAGEAKTEEGLGSGIQMVQEFIDADAFDLEQNADHWDSDIFDDYMKTGKAAMQFAWGAQNSLFLKTEEGGKFAVMPFRNHAGDAFIGTTGSYYIGLAKRLAEKGNEKKLQQALRVMEWLSTEDGQRAITPSEGSVIYPLIESRNEQTIPLFRKLWYDNLDGIKAPMLYTGYEDVLVKSAEYIVEGIKGEHDLSGLGNYMDEIHADALDKNANAEDVYMGSFAKDFTHAETVQFMADAMQSRGDSDLTLVSDGERIGEAKNFEGVPERFYEGLFPYDWMTVVMPGSETMDNPIVQMQLTGAEIKELLTSGKQMVLFEESNSTQALGNAENIVNEEGNAVAATSRYPYYWSGISVQKKGEEVTSITLGDGTAMEPETVYKVSFALGDYMDVTEAAGQPKELSYTVKDVFEEYLHSHSPAEPGKVQP